MRRASHTTRPGSRRAAGRRAGGTARLGFMTLELAMTLPILCVVLFALFEFSMLFFARGELVQATRVGARTATMPGATPEDVERQVRRVLRPQLSQQMSLDVQLGQQTGDVVTVAIGVPMWRTAPNLLWPIGFDLRTQALQARTRMIKE